MKEGRNKPPTHKLSSLKPQIHEDFICWENPLNKTPNSAGAAVNVWNTPREINQEALKKPSKGKYIECTVNEWKHRSKKKKRIVQKTEWESDSVTVKGKFRAAQMMWERVYVCVLALPELKREGCSRHYSMQKRPQLHGRACSLFFECVWERKWKRNNHGSFATFCLTYQWGNCYLHSTFDICRIPTLPRKSLHPSLKGFHPPSNFFY